jgi:hypothetical protein
MVRKKCASNSARYRSLGTKVLGSLHFVCMPNFTEEDIFYLQMEDDFGKTALSPVFALSHK